MSAERPVPSVDEVWDTYDEMEARLTAPLSARMLVLGDVGPCMRVLDVATGRGEPAIPAAHRVGPAGSVLGVDVSPTMLERARARATREGLTNLELRVLDAASLQLVADGRFDAVLARWGLMYLPEPVAALDGARRALKLDGRLVAAVLVAPERASYWTLPRRLLQRYRALPPVDAAAPDPFRYADPERLRRDVEAAGLTIVHTEELELPVMEAATDDELVAWVRAFGLTRLLNGLPDKAQRAWEADLLREAEPLRRDGRVQLGAVTRIVVATAARPTGS